jgi:flagellar basal body P-ring protein FlgI
MSRSVRISLFLLLACAVVLSACTTRAKRPERAVDVNAGGRDVPEVLSNTVGAYGQINGLQPQFVSGYGLVVGLNGTGSGDAPLGVRAMLMDEMLRNGVGREGTPLADVTPAQLIDDPNTAVVLVRATIPPAAPKGFRFDALISTLPGTSTTSLEGGTLYTTDLRRGLTLPGAPDTFPIARARGPVLINPLAAPPEQGEAPDDDDIVRTVGRVLSGGVVDSRFRPTFRLDSPSHARARAIVQAINARFPQGDRRAPSARGMNEDSIELNVPAQYADEPERFFNLVLHTRVDQRFTEEWARRYVSAIQERPTLSTRVGYALEALGKSATSYVRQLYDSPEVGPRLSGLRVGAHLRDPLTRPHLEQLALEGSPSQRVDAIGLLAMLPQDRRIDLFLGRLVDDEDIAVRVAAYEALDERFDPRIARVRFRDRFELHVVPAERPMIYFTQQGAPKIVLFSDMRLSREVFVSAWDDRLMVDTTGEHTSAAAARVFFQDYRSGSSSVHTVSDSVAEFVEFLVHDTTPEEPWPGLNLTYSQTLSALQQLVDASAIDADFVPETDKLQLEFLRAAEVADAVTRPELSEDGPVASLTALDEGPTIVTLTAAGERDTRRRERDEEWDERRSRYVVPGPAAQSGPGSETRSDSDR